MFILGNEISPTTIGLFVATAAWVLPWKGWALWRASQRKQFGWFALLLVVNVAGILEILYALILSRTKTERRSYGLAALAVLVSLGLLLGMFASLVAPTPRALVCTKDAKFCSDGSTVGRAGKACEFATCSDGRPPLTGVPSAETFPNERKFSGAPAAVDFSSNADARAFRTLLTRAAAAGPNFAGSYTVATWGCGTSCQTSAVIDAETGAIIAYGLPSSFGVSYSKGSRLLVVNPFDQGATDSETTVASDYYVVHGNQLQFIGTYDGRTRDVPVCIQVMTKAVNPMTKAVVEFPSPCRTPFGWQVVE